MEKSKLSLWVILCLIPGFLVGCQSRDAKDQTLASLKRISDDFPLYEMHYQGDYGFDARIKWEEQSAEEVLLPKMDFACSCFAALGDPEKRFFGRNFDWYDHTALVLFTEPPNGYASLAMVDLFYLGYNESRDPLDDPDDLLQSPYLPFDGMNEKGLAVGMMAVSHAEGGDDPDKITLDSLELIRLLLDHAADVSEALVLMSSYNVEFGNVPVHYLIADAAGSSAVVEYLGGQPVVQQGTQAWQVSTNFIIAEEQPQGADSSCWRYNRLYLALQENQGWIDEIQGMNMLQNVAQDGETATRWSWIFNLTQRQARLVFRQDYQQVYEFTLGE